MENNSGNKRSAASSPATGAIAIVVVGIFVLCVIVMLAKSIFTINSAEVPEGLDTATINTNESSLSDITESSAVEASTESSKTDSSVSESSTTTSDESGEPETMGTMYVTEYSYLHVAPDKDAENIVCMSPGVAVTVLGYEDNGYVKITFQNIDGPLTGYLYKDYLTTYDPKGTTTQTTTATEYYYQETQPYSQDYGYGNAQ